VKYILSTLILIFTLTGCSISPKTPYCKTGVLDKSKEHCIVSKNITGVVKKVFEKDSKKYLLVNDDKGLSIVVPNNNNNKVGDIVNIILYENTLEKD